MSEENINLAEIIKATDEGSVKISDIAAEATGEPAKMVNQIVEKAQKFTDLEPVIMSEDNAAGQVIDVEAAYKFLTEEELPPGTQIITSPAADLVEDPAQPAKPELPPATVNEIHDETIVEEQPQETPKNVLGTQDFCPKKLNCNHYSVEHCKQAKLEADHRAACPKGEYCDCFHPGRGIPQPFRRG